MTEQPNQQRQVIENPQAVAQALAVALDFPVGLAADLLPEQVPAPNANWQDRFQNRNFPNWAQQVQERRNDNQEIDGPF